MLTSWTAGLVVDLLNSNPPHLRDLDGLVRLGGGRLGAGSTSVVLARLADDGLVHRRSDGVFALTPGGRSLAVSRRWDHPPAR